MPDFALTTTSASQVLRVFQFDEIQIAEAIAME